ncbi:ATP-NAD kinase-like domain-containing protein [Phlyctochytrium arcticum]|nr:ATP-NAD kinase-like domain-containing protein [Phlyctochytrium arcticum]
MFNATVSVEWDNFAQGAGRLPWQNAGLKTEPVKAELRITEQEILWTTTEGIVTRLQMYCVFGINEFHNRPKPSTSASNAAILEHGQRTIQSALSTGRTADLENKPKPYLLLHAVELKNKKRSDGKPRIRQVLFRWEQDDIGRGGAQMAKEAAGLGGKKQVLVLLNPFGGTKQAPRICKEIVVPMLTIAGIPVDMRETQRREHATDIARELRVSDYSAAITVSGDGVFHEVVNGLLTRPDWDQARKLPLGIVGSGSGNGMNMNLDSVGRETAVLSVIKGHTRPMDIFSVTQGDNVTYSHLQIMWTLLADVDFESESYRFMGNARMTVAAVIRIIRQRTYWGTLYMLPVEDAEKYAHDSVNSKFILENATRSTTPPNKRPDPQYPPRSLSPSPSRSSTSTRTPLQNPPSQDSHSVTLSQGHHGPPRRFTANPTAHENWPTKISSSFSYFIATNLPWLSTTFLGTPSAQLSDGALHAVYSHHLSRLETLRCVADQASGDYVNLPYVRTCRVRALVLEPKGWTWNRKESHGKSDRRRSDKWIDISGERYPPLPTRVEVIPGLINVLAPIWLDEKKSFRPVPDRM